jgi:rhodanese-related sulfurtransferase|tara:strand:+ start:379 stop:753 length:375 start_codon:yes stop_codon:yes gene_type:complete
MKNIIIIMTLFSSIFGANAQQNDTIKILNPSDFKVAIKSKDVQLVDVRTADEFKAGAIESALNIDFFQQENFTEEFEKLDKEQPVYLYCRSGSRSQQAAGKLKAMGFTKIYDLQGGYMGWPFKG